MVKRSVVAAVVAIVIIAIIIGAVWLTTQIPPTPTPTPTPTPVLKRTLTISFANVPTLDPAVGSDEASSSAFVNLYDTLVYPTKTGEVVPHLAERWDVSPDGLTWTFYLRKGVKFHDGKELTAEDVVFSTKRFVTIGEGYSYLLSPYLEDVRAIDDYTVEFKLKTTFGPFLMALVRLYILNKDLVMKNIKIPGPYGEFGDYGKAWLLTNDAGSGPYKLKEVKLEEYVIFERFEDYWGYFKPNAPDEVKFIGTSEPVTIRTLFARGELDITDQWQPYENLLEMAKLKGAEIVYIPSGGMFYLMIHTKKAPTDDIHFRKAMAYAFDYNTVVEKIFVGTKLAKGPVSAVVPGHDPTVFQYTRDLDKAREELMKSKYYPELEKYEVEYWWIAEVPDEEKVALLFAKNMEEIGIKVKVVKVPWLTVIDGMARPETSPHIVSIFVAPHYLEAGSILESRYHSKSAPTWEQNEWLLDPELDAAIEDAIATLDMKERFAKYAELQHRIVELCPSLFLFDMVERRAYYSYYVDWYAAKGEGVPVLGYFFDLRLIEVFPEKKAELFK